MRAARRSWATWFSVRQSRCARRSTASRVAVSRALAKSSVAAGGSALLVKALADHAADGATVRGLLGAAAQLCVEDDQNKAMLHVEGVTEQLLAALEAFADYAAVLAATLATLLAMLLLLMDLLILTAMLRMITVVTCNMFQLELQLRLG